MTNNQDAETQAVLPALPNYRVIQLEWSAGQGLHNDTVIDFDSLVTHHPFANRDASIVDGITVAGEPGRLHAMIGGEIQEIEAQRNGRTFDLNSDQVLLKKDFMLEDSRIATGGGGVRDVDVPSPMAGYIGRVDTRQGLVDIYDQNGGDVIARIRHMNPISVQEGDTVEYGQSLGTQSNQATGAIHTHMEVDTRYYQQYENYIADLTNGRLPIDTSRRTQGIEALPVVDDGAFRLGESNPRVQDLQRVLVEQGYTGVGGVPIETDGVYRLNTQGAVIAFQRANGLPQTGDIDPATLRLTQPLGRRELDRGDYMENGRMPVGEPNQEQRAQAPQRHENGPPRQEMHDGQHPRNPQQPVQPGQNERLEQAPQIAPRRGNGGQAALGADDLNPQDKDQHEKIRVAVQKLGFEGEPANNITAALLLATKEHGDIKRIDDITFNETGKINPAGTLVFAAYRPYGEDKAPFFKASVEVAEASKIPAEKTFQNIESFNQQQSQQQVVAQQQAQEKQQNQQTQGITPDLPGGPGKPGGPKQS
jgi:peptidoglycan hydrolase-like protein with peptidoglycan-binding domain